MGCQNWASLKVWFLPCEIHFFDVGSDPLCFVQGHLVAAWKGPSGRPRAPKEPFPNFRGGPRDPKVARSLSKRGLGGALRAPWVVKNRNGDQKCVFEIVKKTLVFIVNLDM